MKSTKCIGLIGMEGSGKTTAAFNIAKNVNDDALRVFDINKEWTHRYKKPFNPDMEKFIEETETVRNCLNIYEDATGFFSRRGRESKLIQQMTARRHTGNSFMFLFHAFADVPPYIMRKMTDLIIFRTLDDQRWMWENYKHTIYYEAWEKVQKLSEKSKFWSTYPPPPGSVPPSVYIKR